jgi:polyisoprenoid-binding protein YceI
MIRRIALSVVLLAAAVSAVAAPQKYDIDKNHTYVTFSYDHFGFSKPVVTLDQVNGELQLDTADLSKSSVSVTLPLEGLHTHVPKLDEHLRSPDFFDAAKFPEIAFKSNKVEKVGNDGLKISGDLTLHGVTKPVVLNAKINKIGENPMMKSESAGFDADVTIKRSEWGVDKYVPNVSDEIKIHISLDSHKAKS